MEHFIGFDVSNKTIAACVLDKDGNILDEREIFTHKQDILDYLAPWQETLVRIGFEVGQMSPWLYHFLKDAGFPAICLEIRHASAAIKSQPIKTDKNDAQALAQMMRLGWYKSTFVKSPKMQKLRMLLCHRQQLNQQIQNLRNAIRGSLKSFGIKLGSVRRGHYKDAVYLQIGDDTLMLQAIQPLLIALEHMEDSFKVMSKTVQEYAHADPICQLLVSIPGIDEITSLAFRATIETPERFKRARDIGPFLGLIPRKYASGEVDKTGGITKCGDRALRSYLYEAGLVILTRVKKSFALKEWGLEIAKRSNFKKAAIAVARKLAIICLRLWKDQEEFNWNNNRLAMQRAA